MLLDMILYSKSLPSTNDQQPTIFQLLDRLKFELPFLLFLSIMFKCRLQFKLWRFLAVFAALGVVVLIQILFDFMPGQSYAGALPALKDSEKTISANLKMHVEELSCVIGERHLFKPATLKRATDYIKRSLAQYFSEIEVQKFSFGNQEFENVAVQVNGTSQPERIIVIGAHYDSVVDCPGANDNGSGVAAVLELARLFSDRKPEATIRFVLFPNEEQCFNSEGMGSYHYAKRSKEKGENIISMVSLETIGYFSDQRGSQKYPAGLKYFYPNRGNFIGFIGTTKGRKAIKRLLKAFRKTTSFPSAALSAPAIVPGVDWSDHQWFDRFGYPALMVTDTAFYRYPYYHTPEDTVDKIDFDKTARVVAGLDEAFKIIAN